LAVRFFGSRIPLVCAIALGSFLGIRWTVPPQRSEGPQARRGTAAPAVESTRASQARRVYDALPLAFEAGERQAGVDATFVARVKGATTVVTPRGAVFAPANADGTDRGPALRMTLAGANATSRLTGVDGLPGTVNYFLGDDPTKWRTNVPTFARVRDEQVYPGIDLIYYGTRQQLEYDFVVAPGADPGVIAMTFEGARDLAIDAGGDLVARLDGREVRQHKPRIYQRQAAGTKEIGGGYVLAGDRVGFRVGRYDASLPLVIDPVLVLSYSTFLGGTSFDDALAIAVDADGNTYLTGLVQSPNFPAVNPIQATYAGSVDVFVSKLNPSGSALVYSTFLGGSGLEEGLAIAVDAAGDAFVAGVTLSSNFPTVNPFQAASGGSYDVFVAKLNPTGSALVYSSYLGGSGADGSGNGTQAVALTIDSAGNAYVAGGTSSSNFPTVNALQPALASSGFGFDAFLTKINPAGSALVYSTYLGGSGNDVAKGVAVDSFGNAYVTGSTLSTNFPTVHPIQATFGGGTGSGFFSIAGGDVFVTKINATGSAVFYSTYLGGSGDDVGNAIAIDSSGAAYVTGDTTSSDFPTASPIQAASGGAHDAFVLKINPAGSALVYSTYLGGSFSDRANAIAVDPGGNVHVVGITYSTDFPSASPIQANLTTRPFFRTTSAGSTWSASATGLTATGVSALAIDPTNPATLYAGNSLAGDVAASVFKSTDGGATWNPSSGGMPFMSVNVLAIAPATPSTLYAGTLNGLFQSTDAGANWTFLSGQHGLPFGNIFALAIDPLTPATIYSGLTTGIYKSVDAGANWTAMNTGLTVPFVTAIGINPATPSTLFTATFGGVFKSTNGAGAWTNVTPALQTGQVFSLLIDSGGIVYAATQIGVVKTTNGGTSWIPVNTGLPLTSFGLNVFSLAINPASPSTIYAATSAGVFKTTNSGASWTASSTGLAISAAMRAAVIAIDPVTPSTVYEGVPAISDAFVARLDATGSTLTYSTPLGGTQDEFGNGIALDRSGLGIDYIAGATDSPDFPTVAAFQPTLGGSMGNAFVSRLAGPQVLPPTVSLSPIRINFGAVNNGAGTLTKQTPAQTIALTQTGTGTVTWTAAADQPWITVSPSSGTGPGTITVSVQNNAHTLPTSGTLSGAVTVTTAGAQNNPRVSVNLTVLFGTSAGPTGSFDTPSNGLGGITGSIAVTGWAVDDLGTTAVRIFRAPVAGENPASQVFIGNATFVIGARPDIAATFPTRPFADRAGWGYLLLTNFLPNSGNGTFTLFAYADDLEGNSTLLGSKTITCTNATATFPFGAIDTPDQGGTASGTAYVNFGWVLAAQPTASGLFIPFDGSTVRVFVDSAPIGTVTSYNNARPDIQALFPGFANTDGAVGFKIIDTTKLANGLHTIFWLAADNIGTTAGIGSRFFTVSNSSAGLVAAPERASAEAARLLTAVTVAHSFDDNAPSDVVVPDATGVVHARVAPLEPLTIALDPGRGPSAWRGYEMLNGAVRPLPIGAHLDERTGVFAWAPPPGFGGVHHLVFIRTTDGREDEIRVDVLIGAAGPQR
jgi:hypothetical protein